LHEPNFIGPIKNPIEYLFVLPFDMVVSWLGRWARFKKKELGLIRTENSDRLRDGDWGTVGEKEKGKFYC